MLDDRLQAFVDKIKLAPLSEVRKSVWEEVITYVETHWRENRKIRLNFVCTHNSRRSQLAQVWAKFWADYYGFSDVEVYSGGTETTAVYPMIIHTLEAVGFSIYQLSAENNPIYMVSSSDDFSKVLLFSKHFAHPFNPDKKIAAVMTCDQVEANCPVVPGAEARFAVLFDDPKEADNTPKAKAVYAQRNEQIASELHYVFNRLKTRLYAS